MRARVMNPTGLSGRESMTYANAPLAQKVGRYVSNLERMFTYGL